MKRQETVQTDHKVKAYMQKNKLRSMFTEMTKQLVLKKPGDPISYLIEYLDKRTKKQIICIKGYSDDERNRLANIVSNKFNFKLIDVCALFKGQDYHFLSDGQINKKVCDQLKNPDNKQKGIIISGYPNNLIQLDFVQKSGILPDRYFYLPADEAKLREQYRKNYDEDAVNNLIMRNQMEDKEIIQNLGDMLDFLSDNFDNATQKLHSTIKIKDKSFIPYDSPRAIFLHPPYLLPPNINCIIDRFSLYHINIQKAMIKLCGKQNFKDYVEQYIRKTGKLSKEIQLALIQTQCRTSAARNKGFILSGWPCRKQSISFFKEKFLNPHFMFIFHLEEDKCIQQFNKLNEGDPSLFSVNKKPQLQVYKDQLKKYNETLEIIRQRQKIQILPWQQNQKQLLKTYQSLVENTKIYS